MMHFIPPPQSELAINNDVERKKAFNPIWSVLQGLFFIGLGIFFLVINWGSPYKEMTGHVQNWYDYTNVDGQYNASYLQISTDPTDLFIFDKNALHLALTDQLFKNERVDIYYSYPSPKRIVALQMYDRFGHPATKFTTTEYTASQNASPLSNAGRDIGVILILLGTLWVGTVVFVLVRTRRQMKRPIIRLST